MTKYNTNLAAEFYVLSMLHRIGADASLTLGNKKAVDIFIFRKDRTSLTIDVKGLKKKYDWPADNIKPPGKDGHFIALVCFEGKIENPEQTPSVWVIPSQNIERFIKKYKTRTVVSRALVTKNGVQYKHAWSLITA